MRLRFNHRDQHRRLGHWRRESQGRARRDGRIVAVTQQPCAPHLGLAYVEQAIRAANAILGPADLHAVTMTAELSDAFEDRLRGVASIAAIFTHEIDALDILFYAGAAGFVGKADVARAAPAIASANWRASAALVARGRAEALFIDMGSTTTDIVPISGGAVAALGEDDAARLSRGELVYTGLLRGAPATGLALAPRRRAMDGVGRRAIRDHGRRAPHPR